MSTGIPGLGESSESDRINPDCGLDSEGGLGSVVSFINGVFQNRIARLLSVGAVALAATSGCGAEAPSGDGEAGGSGGGNEIKLCTLQVDAAENTKYAAALLAGNLIKDHTWQGPDEQGRNTPYTFQYKVENGDTVLINVVSEPKGNLSYPGMFKVNEDCQMVFDCSATGSDSPDIFPMGSIPYNALTLDTYTPTDDLDPLPHVVKLNHIGVSPDDQSTDYICVGK